MTKYYNFKGNPLHLIPDIKEEKKIDELHERKKTRKKSNNHLNLWYSWYREKKNTEEL